MKLNYITCMVRDIEKSVAFYENLAELKVVRRFNPGMGEIAFLGNAEGETMLELIQFENVEKISVKGMVMSFAVESPEALKSLREKAVELGYAPSEIMDQGPKPAHFRVADPDEIVVEFGL